MSDLSHEGELRCTRPRDLRELRRAANDAWTGHGRQERLYLIWLAARSAITLTLDPASTPDDWFASALLHDRAVICARLYERTYGERVDVHQEDWAVAFNARERERLAAGLAIDAPARMSAPVA